MSWLQRLKAPPPPPPPAKPLGKALTKRQRETPRAPVAVVEEHTVSRKLTSGSRKSKNQQELVTSLEEDLIDLGPLTADPQVMFWRQPDGAFVCMSREGLQALCATLRSQAEQ
jgi:hypothetical protein